MPYLTAVCPHCGKVYRITDTQSGRKATCSACRKVFTLSADSSSSVQAGGPEADTASRAAPSARTTAGKNRPGQAPREATGTAEPGKRAGEPAAVRPPTHTDTPSPPPNQQPSTGSVGTVGLDRFEVIEELGAGAFGTVYKARDTQLDRLVALKIPRFGALGSEGAAHRFLREARAAGNLRHPNIVPIYDAGKVGESYFIASGFIEGQTLADLMDGDEKLSYVQSAVLIRKLAEALHYAHTKGIIHRDVKPANVMMDADGEPLIMDFGMARRDEGEVLRTQEGARIGTPAYMSPEQHAGQSHLADARSDQWALGVLLYELLTGQRPFQAPNILQVAYQVRETEPERLRKLDSTISKDLETICLKCLEKEPEKRYASCQHLADELARCLRGEPIQARPIGRGERFGRWCRRNPVVSGLILAATVILLLGSAVSSYFALTSEQRRREAEQAATDASQANERANREATRAKANEELATQRACQLETEKSNVEGLLDNLDRTNYATQLIWAQRQIADGDFFAAANTMASVNSSLRGWESNYIDREIRESSRELSGHNSDILAVAISPDGTHAASGGVDKRICLWYLTETGADPRILAGHDGPVTALLYDAKGENILSGSFDGTVRIWNITTGEGEHKLDLGKGPVLALALHPDGEVVAARYHGHIAVWDLDSGLLVKEWGVGGIGARIHPLSLSRGEHREGIAFTPDGSMLVSTDNSGILHGWKTATGAIAVRFFGPHVSTPGIAFADNGSILLAASETIGLSAWQPSTGEKLFGLEGHVGRDVSNLDVSPDGRMVAAGGGDGNVRVWDVSTGALIRCLTGHRAPVMSVAFAPDGKHMVSGSRDKTVRVWDLKRSELTLPQPTETPITVAAIAPSGNWVVTGGGSIQREPVAFVWDLASGKQRLSFCEQDHLLDVNISPDGKKIVASSVAHPVAVWDASTGNCVWELQKDQASAACAAFAANGTCVISAHGSELAIWDASTGKEIRNLRGHEGRVHKIAVAPFAGEMIASADDKSTIRLWNTRVWDSDHEFRLEAGNASALAISPDGTRLVAGVSNGEIQLWSIPAKQLIWKRSAHREVRGFIGFEGVRDVTFSPDGCRVVSCGADGAIKLWESDSGLQVLTLRLKTQPYPPKRIFFSPDGNLLIAAGGSPSVKAWDGTPVSEGCSLVTKVRDVTVRKSQGQRTSQNHSPPRIVRETLTYTAHAQPVTSVAFSPDGTHFASAGGDHAVKLWNVASHDEAATLRGHTRAVSGIVFSPDGRWLASASDDQTVRLWDVAAGKEANALRGHTSSVACVALGSDEYRMASGDLGGMVRVWVTSLGQERHAFRAHARGVWSVDFGPDGKRIATGGAWDNVAKVWDAAAGAEILLLRGHRSGVLSVVFNRDGQRIASGSIDRTIKIWNAVTGQEELTLRGHQLRVESVMFSPDGKRLVSGSDDRTVRVWNAVTGEEIMTLRGHSGDVNSVAISPNGKWIVSGSSDKTVKLWEANLNEN